MRILNLYACLGGNRFLWPDEHEITAVENDPELARLYKERFPGDKVIIGDAHQFLLNNFGNYDFIWSSPPCPSHSRVRITNKNNDKFVPVYPDMSLYEEILLLDNYFEGKYCVENVIPFYTPLIPAKKRGRHLFWTNFHLPNNLGERSDFIGLIGGDKPHEYRKLKELHAVDLSGYNGDKRKDKILRNLVDYEIGKTILDVAMGIFQGNNVKQQNLFD